MAGFRGPRDPLCEQGAAPPLANPGPTDPTWRRPPPPLLAPRTLTRVALPGLFCQGEMKKASAILQPALPADEPSVLEIRIKEDGGVCPGAFLRSEP